MLNKLLNKFLMDEEGFEDEGLEDGVDKMLNKLLDRSQEVQVVARRFTTRDNREDSITIYAPLNMYELSWSDQIEFKSLLLWCTNGLLDTSIIHWWAMNLYSLATKRGKNKCAFLNPSFTHYGECKMNSGNVIAHIKEVKDHHNDKSIFIAPYFQGRHWTLLVVHKTMERGWTGYLLDSNSYLVDTNSTIIDKRHPSSYSLISYLNEVFDIHLDNWTMVNCHQQVDKWEGGYYVMRFMHDLVLVKQNNFPRNIWNDDNNLSSKELDQIVVHSASQFITFVLAPGDRRANQ